MSLQGWLDRSGLTVGMFAAGFALLSSAAQAQAIDFNTTYAGRTGLSRDANLPPTRSPPNNRGTASVLQASGLVSCRSGKSASVPDVLSSSGLESYTTHGADLGMVFIHCYQAQLCKMLARSFA